MKYKLTPIKKIEIKKISSGFHDLQVKKTHSYTANNIIVHNCLTSVQTGVGYPNASLINECKILKTTKNYKTKIVADGGFKKFSDITKALALGADYVMLGSMLNKALESCGDTFEQNVKHETWTEPGAQIDQYSPWAKNYLQMGGKLFKKYRGMSTKEVQRQWGREKLKTAEGISKMNKVEYTLEGWRENMEDYLRSSMSYTSSRTLNDFKNSHFEIISTASFKRFDK